ncbi:MAG: beta-propeller domain-containing protein [Candidatus Merdivicinus sp.]|jgi:hypothetical protein
MKQFPEHDVLEQRIRKMADQLETPSSLSPESLLQKLPDRQKVRPISFARKYSPLFSAAACLLLVLAGATVLRNFISNPILPSESSSYSEPDSEVSESDPESLPSDDSVSSESQITPDSQPEPDSQPGLSNSLPEETEESVSDPDANSQTTENSTQEPQSGQSESSETQETSEPQGPPPAVNLDYPGLQEQESIEGYRDIYNAMEGAQRNAVLQNSVPNTVSFAMPAGNTVVIAHENQGSTVVSNSRITCTIADDGENSMIRIYQLNGPKSTFAGEFTPQYTLPSISGMHSSYVAVSELLLEDDILTIIGNARYWSDTTAQQQNLTVMSFYDVSDPSAPVFLSTLCQDGRATASYTEDGFLVMISQHSIPSTRGLDEETLNSYLPASYENGLIRIPRRDQIQIGQDLDAPVYTTISMIDLSEPSFFADTFCYLGGSDALYVSDQFICLARNKSDSAQVMLASFDIGNSGISLNGENILNGTLIGNIEMLPKNKTLAVTITDSTGSPSLYLLDKKMNVTSSLEDFAPAGSIASIDRQDSLLYFCNYAGDSIAVVDCTSARYPRILQKSPTRDGSIQSIPFGSLLLKLDYAYSAEGTVSGVTLGVYDGTELQHSIEISGDLYLPAMNNHEYLYQDENSGLIGFGITNYINTENSYTTQYTYRLYQYREETGFKLIADFPLYESAETPSLPEYETGFLLRQVFYLVLPDKMFALDPNSGKILAEVPAANS